MEFKLSKRAIFLLFWDIAATYGAYSLAAVLTGQVHQVFSDTSWAFFLGALALVNILFLAMFRLYSNLWEYASYDELLQILAGVTLGTFVGALVMWLMGVSP